MSNKAGFTLVEAMVAALLGALVLAAVIAIQMMGARSFAVGTADAMLERTGNLLMDRIVRGPSGQYGLREARWDSVTVTGGSQPVITFSVDRNDPPTFDTSDDTQCSIYLSPSGIVFYDPDTSVDDNEVPLHADAVVQQMIVTEHPDSLVIELVLDRTVEPFDSDVKVRVITIVRPRLD